MRWRALGRLEGEGSLEVGMCCGCTVLYRVMSGSVEVEKAHGYGVDVVIVDNATSFLP